MNKISVAQLRPDGFECYDWQNIFERYDWLKIL